MEKNEINDTKPSTSKISEDQKQIWHMVITPLNTIFNKLTFSRSNLDVLLESIYNICTQHAQVFIPKSDCSLSDYYQREKQCTAFTTWLLGRLFYLLNLSNLSDVHEISLKCQIKILQVLSSSNTHMFDVILEKYLISLKDLIKYDNKTMVLKYLNPEQEPNIMPELTCIEIIVNDAIKLQIFIFEIISELIPGVLTTSYWSSIKIWTLICDVLESGHNPTKNKAILLTTKLIKHNGFSSENQLNRRFLWCLQKIIELGEPLSSFQYFLEVIYESNGFRMAKDNILLSNILIDIILMKQNNNFNNLKSISGKLLYKILFKNLEEKLTIESHIIKQLIDQLEYNMDGLFLLEYAIVQELKQNSDKENLSYGSLYSKSWKSLLEKISTFLESIKSKPSIIFMLNRCICSASRISVKLHPTKFKYFEENLVNKILENIVWILKNKIENDSTLLMECFETLSNLSKLPEFNFLPSKTADKILKLLALPWINEMKFKELSVDSTILGILEACKLHIKDTKLQCFLLRALAETETTLGHEWRFYLLHQLLTSPISDLSNACFEVFPIALLNHPTPYSMVYKLIEPIIPNTTDSQPSIITALSYIISDLVCIVAGTTILIRELNEDKVIFKLLCNKCKILSDNINNNFTEDCKNFVPSNEGSELLRNTLPRLLAFVNSPLSNVRRNIARAALRFSNHMHNLPWFYTSELPSRLLQLVQDPEVEVRLQLAKVITHLIFDGRWVEARKENCARLREEHMPLSQADRKELSSSEPLLAQCFELLTKASTTSLNNSDASIQETLVITLKEIGSVPLDCVLYPTISIMLLFVAHPYSSMAKVVKIYIKDIAKAHNLKPANLYNRYKKELSKLITNIIVINNLTVGYNLLRTASKIANAFCIPSGRHMIISDTRYFVSYLLPLAMEHEQTLKLLSDLAALNSVSLEVLIQSQFAYIYTYTYLYEKTKLFDDCVTFMQKKSNYSVKDLRQLSLTKILNELLIEYDSNEKKVIHILKDLARDDAEYAGPRENMNKEAIAQFLHQRFLGILIHFDSCLVTHKSCESDKKKALRSLPRLIRLMGTNYITPVRFKLLATLRTALKLNYSNFPDLNCDAWLAFVHNVDVNSIGPLLSTIFASLLPLLKDFPSEVDAIFGYLINKNESVISEYIKELYFVPKHPAIENIYRIIHKHVELNRPKDIKARIYELVTYISHENLDVRMYALEDLRKYLSEHRGTLRSYIESTDIAQPAFIELLETLVFGCREADQDLNISYLECLGEIGAIDPGNLPRIIKLKNNSEFLLSVNSQSFGCAALNQLVKAFMSTTLTQRVDAFSLAIQELLKVYEISPNGPPAKSAVWHSFPDRTKELMTPLLSSYYTSTSKINTQLFSHPIYGSTYSSSLLDWGSNLATLLVSKIENPGIVAIFEPCLLSCRQDLSTLQFFLPYIILHVILLCDESTKTRLAEELRLLICEREKCLQLADAARLSIPVWTADYSKFPSSRGHNSANFALCSKTVYSLIDFLHRWILEWKITWTHKRQDLESARLTEDDYKKVQEFVDRFSKLTIATGSYECQEYARSLMYMELYVRQNPKELHDHLWLLTKIYAQLEETDAVAGIRAIQEQEQSLEELILSHEVTGQYHDALACYERLAHDQGLAPIFMQGLVQCYLHLNLPFSSLNIAQGVIAEGYNIDHLMQEQEAEMLWRMSRFDELERLDFTYNSGYYGVDIGRALVSLRQGALDQLILQLRDSKNHVLQALRVVSVDRGGYQQGYKHVVRLHILSEIEKISNLVTQIKVIGGDEEKEKFLYKEFADEWSDRLRLMQPSTRIIEPVLGLRRTLLELACKLFEENNVSSNVKKSFMMEIGHCWLKSAEIARKDNLYQQAYNYILNTEKYKPKELFIEKAKLHWDKGEQDQAFMTLKRGIQTQFPDADTFKSLNPSERMEDRKLCAQAKLLIASYNDEMVNVDVEVNIANYKAAVEVCRQWEKSLVSQAQYYDRVFASMHPDTKDTSGGEIQLHMLNYFGKSLQYGCEYIYQSMPRLLSIWLDYGTRLHEVEKKYKIQNKKKKNKSLELQLRKGSDASSSSSNTSDPEILDTTINKMKDVLKKMTQLIETYLERLPPYMFLTAFSQIVSRICHPEPEVYRSLKNILVKLLVNYPQRCMWMFMAVIKSTHRARAKRCEDILNDHRVKNAKLTKLIVDFNNVADKLIELTNKPLHSEHGHLSVNSVLRGLPKLLESNDLSPIMIPAAKLRKVSLPKTSPDGYSTEHNPFPQDMVFIQGMEDDMLIIASLVKPRKITLKGSDGKKYMILCKPKDDLRRDFRLMEFNAIVNQYLQNDADSRLRNLHIRTYSVVPLNEECGLIEWVPNLVGLRPILNKLFKEHNTYVPNKVLRSLIYKQELKLEEKRELFKNNFLARHPAVLSEWFLQTFMNPCDWFAARTDYTRTTAVMSMVGYIMGLGDRHGENILLDSSNGDTVHVDFNCLFNKGENFEWPERVPFRLTHNMVDAMGPLGVEGVFRCSCEITLRVLRQHVETLMSVLRPFVYDPLVSWKNKKSLTENELEPTNELAVKNLNNLELRLQGMVRTQKNPFSLAMSVEGQANNLILEATNIDNLCQMYVGWGPYL